MLMKKIQKFILSYSTLIFIFLSFSFLFANEDKGAIKLFKQGFQENPKDSGCYLGLAEIYEKAE